MLDINTLKLSVKLLVQEMLSRGWEIEQIVADSGFISVKHPDCHERWFIYGTSMASFASGILCDDKWLCYALFQGAGYPVAETQKIQFSDASSRTAIVDFLAKYEKIVVKPIETNHGKGISLNLISTEQVLRAVEFAKQFTKKKGCLLQKQYEGNDHRLLVVGGKFIAAAQRKPAFVVGDGLSTVRELIDAKNRDPLRGDGHATPLTKIDLRLLPQSILRILDIAPANKEEVQLLSVANLSQGGEAIDITDSVHPELRELACLAANTVQASVCGVDIMTRDITQSVREGGAIILEVNKSPGIRMHHFPSIGKSRNVAKVIVDEFAKCMMTRSRQDASHHLC